MTLARLRGDDAPRAAREWCARERAAGRSLGFVPTMGALHAGHLALLRRSRAENERTSVSVFVNPLQFADPDDLARYPRDLERDAELLEREGCDMLFTGTLAGFFPEADALDSLPLRDPGPRARGLEGDFRPGHFAGVATIVARLFELVRPERAYFGAKDYQQTLVVRDLAAELGFPEVVVCPTVREADGLALSSRNGRLLPRDREQALALSRALFAARLAWRDGERDAGRLRGILCRELERPGVELEYAELRDPGSWDAGAPTGELRAARALVAARVGGVRLLDNLALGTPAEGRAG